MLIGRGIFYVMVPKSSQQYVNHCANRGSGLSISFAQDIWICGLRHPPFLWWTLFFLIISIIRTRLGKKKKTLSSNSRSVASRLRSYVITGKPIISQSSNLLVWKMRELVISALKLE